MPTRPTNSPLFATDPLLTGGPQIGLSTRLSPGAGAIAQGFYKEHKLPGRGLSYLLGVLGDWCSYFDSKTLAITALNWPHRATFANVSAVNSSTPLAWDPLPSAQGAWGSTGVFMVTTANTSSITSDDGTVWRNSVSFGGTLGAAAYDLAVGQSGGVRAFLASGVGNTNLIRSVDAGTTWTLVATGIPSSSVLCNGPGEVWVACGAFGAVQRSIDGGFTWSAAGVSISGWGLGARRIVWNGILFVMIAGSSLDKVATSPDGLTWTVRTLPATQVWTGLAYSASEPLWMAVGLSAAVAVSVDGLTWTARAVSVSVNDLAVIGSVWVTPVLNGEFGGMSYSIDRGLTWNFVAVGDHRTANGWNRIIAADGRFLVAHATGTQLEFALSLRTN